MSILREVSPQGRYPKIYLTFSSMLSNYKLVGTISVVPIRTLCLNTIVCLTIMKRYFMTTDFSERHNKDYCLTMGKTSIVVFNRTAAILAFKRVFKHLTTLKQSHIAVVGLNFNLSACL